MLDNVPRASVILEGRDDLGRLVMGMRPVLYDGYDLAVSCEEHLARSPMESFTGVVIHCAMRDEDEFPLGANQRFVGGVVADALREQKKVYVHCTGGFNRSAVVVAEALKHLGYTGREAVELMRARRDPFVLCNKAFERWVTGERLPTAETTLLGQ